MGNNLRRSPDAVITAHRMDPSRRELYVEGPTDRCFFRWLSHSRVNSNSLVLEISSVDFPGSIEGGNRSRLILFAKHVSTHVTSIRVFVDADFDRILGISSGPQNIIWLTDGRDLESYYLREDCFEKIVHLSLNTELFSGQQLLHSLRRECRILGFLRLVDKLQKLQLPFQRTNLIRHLKFSRGNFEIDLRSYLRALLSNADISHHELDRILATHHEIMIQYSHVGDNDIIHGDDILTCIGEVLRDFNIDRKSASALLRATFQKDFTVDYPFLTEALQFICQ